MGIIKTEIVKGIKTYTVSKDVSDEALKKKSGMCLTAANSKNFTILHDDADVRYILVAIRTDLGGALCIRTGIRTRLGEFEGRSSDPLNLLGRASLKITNISDYALANFF